VLRERDDLEVEVTLELGGVSKVTQQAYGRKDVRYSTWYLTVPGRMRLRDPDSRNIPTVPNLCRR